jgi:preprotein translocase subunit Sss1
MNKKTVTALIAVVGLAIIGAAGYLIHHLANGQMAM